MIFIALSFIAFDVQITVSIQLIHLIREGVLTWISEVKYHSQNGHEEGKYNDRMKIMFEIYVDLLGAFELFKRVYQFMHFFLIADGYIFSLFYVQEMIEVFKYHIRDDDQFHMMQLQATINFWIMRRTLFMVLLCLLCEKFYMTISEADATCCNLLKSFEDSGEILFSELLTNFMVVTGIIKDMMHFILHSVFCEKFYIAVEKAETACVKKIMNVDCSCKYTPNRGPFF
ncbi:hypothetical protein HF086_006444 [Spodoptera exigua]|uniref:Uncharacterized protein n=1 Tax=Spodoptera exigua TaxID=7107 RepID=A0A922SNZ1_SPOEX|nr:hypothetical protein HF086_006444 [Spodoptera exigua]